MKPLFFLTGNKHKLAEVRALIPHVEGIDMDLPELQEIDPHTIIAAKLREAQKHHPGSFIVEDTSLFLEGMNGLPGPLVKWFLKTVGVEGIYKLTETFENAKATARTLIGYADEAGTLHFFEGVISGTVVSPRGSNGFGWDALFQPDGSTKTFAEMSPEEKTHYSMRRIALEALQRYLETVD
ncbi:inosine triphosphate pyrophosphatase [Thermosporothrix hazakensis]|jgi:non-canonical purine NTP pyrophosphatase (RdgB/HAM1 family)|uniref:Inosine triphosphate pyrophosphatase n=2 Tax=Thermosporothrix TaxID=768650 RepID=A0A326TYU1_THEHA|nr:non-canonical purine NTP pyrophosphatase [Thermosporothrix hazakensis]PZW22525.1 inosine triphosphate pyrophosphatase [Thermosporothrix hazakensis]BBH87782.1 non-canonical purine NTP pyrophosphatase [Thermosporothrix sp. COM3]GCE50214.1 non-canonical purine NTP pyrophosphatase [Thermosporothrix hazakensis]